MSTGFLLDTSVIAALAPGRELHLNPSFATWLLSHDAQLFLPSIAIAEMAQGIGKLRRAGSSTRVDRLEVWLDQLIAGFGERILPLDTAAARLAGQISDQAIAKGRHPGFADVAIAAIATQANLLLLTQNIKHFQPLGVGCSNPFQSEGFKA